MRGHPERPARVSKTLEKLRSQTELPISWTSPAPVNDELILRVHTKEHLAAVKRGDRDFDGDTPTYPNIFEHAQRSVGAAVEAMRRARKGEMAFSLIRPPGHHATRDQAMGFCYFGSIAIAALEALAMGAANVAIYDFDVHHGNGTEDILLDRSHAAFCSIHQHPLYPGTGTSNRGRNCFNYPVPPALPREEYRKVLMKAEDFHWLGEQFRKTNIPVFSVLEGGYSSDLPELIFAYLRGLSDK
jgi:acetoin utilization deacetylase AcuC-like enzyme